MSESVESLLSSDLRIDVEDVAEPPTLLLTWRGKSNQRNPEKVLRPFFERIVEVAKKRSVPVEMRFHELQHFNSSTITSVIDLIEDARKKQVRLIIAYAGAIKWQRVSFDALRVFKKNDGMLELKAS